MQQFVLPVPIAPTMVVPVKSPRSGIVRWAALERQDGERALRQAGRAGRKPRLTPRQKSRLEQRLLAGPQRLGYETSLWTSERVADLIEREFGVRYHPGHVWKILVALGWSCQRPVGRALERNEEAIRHWKKVPWPDIKKKPKKRGERSSFSTKRTEPAAHRCRTWSRRGHTPVLQYHFNWRTLSVIAGITLWNFYFRFYPGAIRAPQIVAFLKHLLRHIPGKLLLVWDRLPAHRSPVVQEFVAAQKGRIHIEYLPAYAPELNPTEYIWGYCKHHKLPNACPKDFAELKQGTRRALRNMRRRPTLITAFWKQASLWPE